MAVNNTTSEVKPLQSRLEDQEVLFFANIDNHTHYAYPQYVRDWLKERNDNFLGFLRLYYGAGNVIVERACDEQAGIIETRLTHFGVYITAAAFDAVHGKLSPV